MFCRNCGKKVEDGIKFCPYCGGAVSAGQESGGTPSQDVILNALGGQQGAGPAVEPAAPGSGLGAAVPPPQQQILGTGNKRRGLGIVAGLGAAAVLMIVLAVVLLSGLLSGPKGTLGKAVAKSMNAYQAASDAVGMPDLQKLAESKKVRADMSLQIKNFSDELTYYTPELEMLKGFGFSASSGYDQAGRKMDFSATAAYGSADLITFWFQADGDVLSVGCPELLDNKSYGINTATLGKDLDKMGADMPDGMENMSFNIFDIMETFSKPVEMDKAAYKTLTDAIEVEKGGKSTVDVNDHNVECTLYQVVIPKDAMRDFLDAMEDAYKDRGMDEEILDLLRAFGMSGSDLDGVRSEIKAAASGEELFDALKQAVKTVGDIELEVYVSDGYVMSVVWETKIDGTRMEITACFGGGKNYADDLSLELRVDDVRFLYESTGNHGTDGGEYTDESSFTVRQGSVGYTFKSEMEYHPKKASDNFEWTVKGDSFSMTAEGQLTTTKDSLFLDLDKLSVNAMGSEMLRLSATYSVGPYTAPSFSSGSPVMIFSLDEDDLEELAYDVQFNAQSWLMDLADDMPELAQLFW